MPDPTLAHRLVAACPDVWAAGMLDSLGRRVTMVVGDEICVVDHDGGDAGTYIRERDGSWRYTARRYVEALTVPPVPDLDDPATAGVLLARLKSMGAFVALTYGTNVDDEPVNHLRVWPDGAGPLSTPHKFDGPALGHACAAALVALVALSTPTPPPTE